MRASGGGGGRRRNGGGRRRNGGGGMDTCRRSKAVAWACGTMVVGSRAGMGERLAWAAEAGLEAGMLGEGALGGCRGGGG